MASQVEAEQIRSEARKRQNEDPLSIDVTPPQSVSAFGTITNLPIKVQSIVIPWQHHMYNCTSINDGFLSNDIAFEDFMKQHVAGWRFATLLQLEAVFMPNHGALKFPFTVECLWTPQSANLTAKALASTFGSQVLIIGGKNMPPSSYVIRCNLNSINPRIRDSVNYNDTPRFNMKYIKNRELLKTYYKKDADGKDVLKNGKPYIDTDKKQLTTCRIYFRGVLRLSAPAFQFENGDGEEEQ